MLNDTIAAISTPMGEGGIGIVRLSGGESLGILREIFVHKRARSNLAPWRVHYGHVVDPATGQIIDEVLAVYMRAPNTYTREDVVELSCHGGPLPLASVLGLALQQGARLARPGEFTLRAFANGRIDLAQAESILDLISAKTQAGLRLAVNQLEGKLSKEVKALRGQVINILAYLTATIDFAEDEIPGQDVASPLDAAIAGAQSLLRDADAGIVYRQGLRAAIVGRPNVGKSSLLNALLRQSRAIVTPVPGTTRDTLEEIVNLQGIPVVLVDTAGITETADAVERLGVERSRGAIEMADLVVLMLDGSEPLQAQDHEIAALVRGRTVVVVVNKADLPLRVDPDELQAMLSRTCTGDWPSPLGPYPVRLGDGPYSAAESFAAFVRVSLLTGDGLAEVEAAITRSVLGGRASASDALLVSNPRHKDALSRALGYLQAARDSLGAGVPSDFVSIDLTSAAAALGEITGETVADDLLENIFGKFCIGK